MSRARYPFGLGVALVLVASCLGERRGLSRDELLRALAEASVEAALPTVPELVELRVPLTASAPPAFPDEGASDLERARRALALGDVAAAESIWERDDPELLALRCLGEAVLVRPAAVVDACGRFLDRSPADGRAALAVRLLRRMASMHEAAGAVVAARGAGWVLGCARAKGSCAPLAFEVNEERSRLARRKKDEAAFRSGVEDSGRIRTARVEGPFDGDLRQNLQREARGQPLVPRSLAYRAWQLEDDDGLFAPAARGAPGLYRLEMLVEGQGPATLFVTSASTSRVRVDGVLVAERLTDGPSPEVTRVDVILGPGKHRIEVLAWSTGRDDRIGIAALDSRGRPALSPTKREGAEALGRAKVMPPPATQDRAADPLEDLFGDVWHVMASARDRFGAPSDEALERARALVSRFGWSPVALSAAAEVLSADRSVPSAVAVAGAAVLWERVLEKWPNHGRARLAAARMLREERPDEALAAYRSLLAVQPAYAPALREFVDLALDRGLVDEARRTADMLLSLERSPENLDAVLPALRASGELGRHAALLEERASIDDGFGGLRRARHLLESGKTSQALEALAVAARHDPASSALDEHLGLLALLRPEEALFRADELVAAHPHDPALLRRRAELLLALRGKEEAKAFVSEKLPWLRESERALALAEDLGIPPVWTARLALGDNVIDARRKRAHPPFPDHGAVALLDDVERIYFEDDSSLLVRHFIVELRSRDAVDAFGEIGTEGVELVRLRVIKPDGATVEPDRHDGITDVSLPQLAAGDMVEMMTVATQRSLAIGASYETRALDGSRMPALSRRYILSFPQGWDERRGVRILQENGASAPHKSKGLDSEGRARTTLTFEAKDVASAPSEPFAVSIAETARLAGYAWGVDLELWARLRGAHVEAAARVDSWIRASAARITGDGSPEQALERIFSFVVRRIEPNRARADAAAVLATGQGERTPLFLALLRAAGLDAAPVALHLTTQAEPARMQPDAFSILAVRIRLADRERYAIVDGNAVLDALPPVARAAAVLDLSREPTGERLSVLPDTAIDPTGVHVQVDLSAEHDGSALTGVVVVTIPPSKADGARRGAQRATEEQLRHVLEQALAEALPGVVVIEAKAPDLEWAGKALRLGASVRVPLPERSAGAVRFDHLFAQGASGGLQLIPPIAGYLAVTERRTPALVAADREVLEVQIALPPPGAFIEAPEPLTMAAGPFRLSQRSEVTNGTLYWRREIATENARVDPSSWRRVHAGLAAVAARVDAQLAFVLPTR